MFEKERVVAICARMGDPLYRSARARLIWAAQTAQATNDLGANTVLVGSGTNLPIKVEGAEGVKALSRLVSGMYNVAADFNVMPLYPPAPSKDRTVEYGHHEAGNLFPRYVQPYVDLVHTRDPRIVRQCIKAKTPVIFEDHNEDYHLSANGFSEDLNDPVVRAVVAITESVADRMVLMGVNRTKIIVQDSGVNSRALERYPTRAKVWRDSLLRKSKYNYLAAYSGGMQTERGIAHILYAAEKMPDVMFAMAGGNGSDIAYWLTQARQMNLSNVRFLDYLPQDQVIELQQAADVVLMTREPGARGAISSPLKFFEYLASGTPVLAAATAVLHEKNTENLAVSWYNPEDPDRIIDALLGAFKKYPRKIEGYKANIAYASSYTWSERQKKIMAFADVDFVFPQAGDPS